jgi:hypothetical protein
MALVSIERSLRQLLLEGGRGDIGWGYEPGRTARLEPTCWALLALRNSPAESDRTLAGWPADRLALLEHRGGLPNWSFHALALATRLALGEAPLGDVQWLAATLVAARGVPIKPSPAQRQDVHIAGWSWITGTFSWVEPTAWAVLALKMCRGRGVVVEGANQRIHDGESLLRDRVCAGGGWNYGNSNVFAKDLPAYVPTTAIALLALHDRCDEAFVRRSLDYLEEESVRHPSVRALALSALALGRCGRRASHVESALRAWFARQPSTDIASLGMALCALERSGVDDVFAY